MPGVIYDTAILSSLKNNTNVSRFPNMSKSVLSQQHKDGYWGANYYQPYDRLLNTVSSLSMMTDLGYQNYSEFEKGFTWLEENHSKTLKSNYPIPTAFEFIYPQLINNIMENTNQNNLDNSRFEKSRKLKIDTMGKNIFAYKSPLLHSMEGVVENETQANQLAQFQCDNGSLFASPSSTSVYLKYNVKEAIPRTMDYINSMTTSNHLLQHFGDYTNFNIVYSLYPITKTNFVFNGLESVPMKRVLKNWTKQGLSFAENFETKDSDDSAIALLLMDYFKIGDSKSKIDDMMLYDGEHAFQTYLNENVPAVLTNVHIMEAFKVIKSDNANYVVDKIIDYIQNIKGDIIQNSKYNASFIMQTANTLVSMMPLMPQLVYKLLQQLEDNIYNQMADDYTAMIIEDEGFALIALLLARKLNFEVNDDLIQQLFFRLINKIDENGVFEEKFIWTSKVQYSPTEMAQSHIYSAILLYIEQFGDFQRNKFL